MSQYTPTVNSDLPFAVADKRKRGYFTVDNIILDEYGERLKPCGLAVYVCLCRFANQDQECWPSHATVARRTGMSKRQVGREIAKLAALELIQVTPQLDPVTKEQTSNLYTLLDVGPGGHTVHGGLDIQSNPVVRRSTKQSPKKKDTHPKLDRKSAYIPAEWADIIRG